MTSVSRFLTELSVPSSTHPRLAAVSERRLSVSREISVTERALVRATKDVLSSGYERGHLTDQPSFLSVRKTFTYSRYLLSGRSDEYVHTMRDIIPQAS